MIALMRNATWSGFAAAVRAAMGLVIALLAVRLLGAERYGWVATLLSLFVLYLTLNSSVFTVLVAKLMESRHPGSGSGSENAEPVVAATMLTVVSIVVLGLLTLVLCSTAPSFLLSGKAGDVLPWQIQGAILAMGILTACQIVNALQAAMIEGAGRLDLAMKCQLIGPVTVSVLLLALLLIQMPVSPSGYVTILCCGALLDLSLLFLVRRRLLTFPFPLFPSRQHRTAMWGLLKSGTTLQAASLLGLFLEPLNKLLLNYLVGPLAVTSYDLVMKVIWGIQSLFAAAMRVFLHMSGELGRTVGLAYSRALSLILVPVLLSHVFAAVFLAWVAHEWISIGDARQFMMFFCIATLSNLGMIYVTPIYVSLIGRGDLHFILRSQAIVAVTNVLVSLTLIPHFGLLGAAFGLLAATAYNVVAIYLRHERTVGLSDGLVAVFMQHAGRYSLSALLLIAALLTSGGELPDYVAQVMILLAATIIMKRELLVSKVLQQMRGRA